MFLPKITKARKKGYKKSSSNNSHRRIQRYSVNQYLGFIKFFPILNFNLNGVPHEREEASLWSALTGRSTEILEKRFEPLGVDKKRG